MKYRIAMWASAGFLVAGCWALYFSWASKDNPVEPIVYALARFSCPIAIAGMYFPIGVYWALVANAATYALVGAVAETLRQKLTHAKGFR